MKAKQFQQKKKYDGAVLQNLDDVDVDRILRTLRVALNENLRNQVKQAAINYSSNTNLWVSKPSFAKSKAILQKVHDLSDKLLETLDTLYEMTSVSFGFRLELSRVLRRDGHELDNLFEEMVSLHNAVHEVEPELQKDLPDVPFILLVEDLRKIFEEATGKKATVSVFEKGGGISISLFLRLVRGFLKIAGGSKKKLSLKTLRRECSRAMKPVYSGSRPQLYGSILTGISVHKSKQ